MYCVGYTATYLCPIPSADFVKMSVYLLVTNGRYNVKKLLEFLFRMIAILTARVTKSDNLNYFLLAKYSPHGYINVCPKSHKDWVNQLLNTCVLFNIGISNIFLNVIGQKR